MNPLIESHQPELASLCRQFRVRRLALFGSAARTDFDPTRSDVDMVVEFDDPLSPGYADRYLDFALAAERVLGRPVDLLTARSIVNPLFERRLRNDLIELYAA